MSSRSTSAAAALSSLLDALTPGLEPAEARDYAVEALRSALRSLGHDVGAIVGAYEVVSFGVPDGAVEVRYYDRHGEVANDWTLTTAQAGAAVFAIATGEAADLALDDAAAGKLAAPAVDEVEQLLALIERGKAA